MDSGVILIVLTSLCVIGAVIGWVSERKIGCAWGSATLGWVSALIAQIQLLGE